LPERLTPVEIQQDTRIKKGTQLSSFFYSSSSSSSYLASSSSHQVKACSTTFVASSAMDSSSSPSRSSNHSTSSSSTFRMNLGYSVCTTKRSSGISELSANKNLGNFIFLMF